ncbi:hypothetical protein QFC19_003350 [Naganishia cerealis]|uniref:Uncharacterized protein n=1 Tax=Naganishia cerealis TaxID=610337 RepID=A0ACC2W2Q2_9TREE|nr:hypothetical protein QFC19_003350 [Naganishia cerealis]
MESARKDQIVYRFYVKTLGVLTDARLEFPAGDVRVDKWVSPLRVVGRRAGSTQPDNPRPQFNLPLPDHELFRPELAPYRAISTTPSSSVHVAPLQDTPAASLAPPLLIAFTLDASAIPAGDRLYWRPSTSPEAKVAVDLGSDRKGKRRRATSDPSTADDTHGIILERWTLRNLSAPASSPNSSSASYRAGIAHFRDLHTYLSELPLHPLIRRIRDRQSGEQGLTVGLKVWSAEGMEESERGLEEAWDRMEQGLVPLHVPIDHLSSPRENTSHSAAVLQHVFPPVILGNGQFELSVEARRDVDFWLDADTESAESDDDDATRLLTQQEYFTPTIRHDSTPFPRHTSHPTAANSRDQKNPVHLAPAVQGSVPAGLSATRPTGPLSSSRTRSLSKPNNNNNDDDDEVADQRNKLPAEYTATAAATSTGKWASPEQLPFAVSPNASSGSFGSTRYGPLQDRASLFPFLCRVCVSSSPIPAGHISRRYSGLGGVGSESGMRSSPLSAGASGGGGGGGGIGLGIVSRSTSAGGGFAPSGTSYDRPSSFHRPSSYLSHSGGRSFTQIGPLGAGANPSSYGGTSDHSRPRLQSLLSSHSGLAAAAAGASPSTPPLVGSTGSRQSSSFSLTTNYMNAVSGGGGGRSGSSRALPINLQDSPTPPIPETHESGDDTDAAGVSVGGGGVGGSSVRPGTSFGASSRNLRRYSSSFGQQQPPQLQQQQQQRKGTPLDGGSTTSSGDMMFGGTSVGGGLAGGESRRTSARGSFDSGGMRRPSVTSLSRLHAAPTPTDRDDIHDFLRTLDLMAQAPSSTSDTSDSLSASRAHSGRDTGKDQPSSGTSSTVYRKPLTKSQLDDTLRRMAGSYTPPFPLPSIPGTGMSPRVPSLSRPTGLPPLSLPLTTLDRSSGTPPQAISQRHSSSVKSSSPLAGEPIRANRIRSSLDTTASHSESTSAASATSSVREQVVEPLTFGKTRSGACDKPSEDGVRGESRRGTVLLRGGFGQFAPAPPSREHSPLAHVGSASPVGSTKFLQSPRRTTDRDVGFQAESERGVRSHDNGTSSRVTAPILSAGAQPLDQGVRSWTHRRVIGNNEGEADRDPPRGAARSTLYTAPASLESRRQRGTRDAMWASDDEDEYSRATPFSDAVNHPQTRQSGMPSTRRKTSDDGDDSIVGNLEMSGA